MKMVLRGYSVSLAILLLIPFFFFFLTIPSAVGNSLVTLKITIYKIELSKGDPIETVLEDGADWHYYITIYDGSAWPSVDNAKSGKNSWLVNTDHVFHVNNVIVNITIRLLDDDAFGRQELADISSYPGGGVEILSGSAPRGAEFHLTYNLRSNNLSGDKTVIETGYLKTSGDFDGSVNIDENDASLWFLISDNYEPPIAVAGESFVLHSGEKANFDGGNSTASPGSSISKYAWDFESDGRIDAEGLKSSYTYTSKGTFKVTLKVTDNFGITATNNIDVTVLNREPTVAFSCFPQTITIKDTVYFTDLSVDIDGSIQTWLWDFGDGTSSILPNPYHKYLDKGEYTVKLTVTDNDDVKNTTSKELTIINLDPTANFTITPSRTTAGGKITFIDNSSDPENKTLQYSWDFGDQGSSTAKNPLHVYNAKGNYLVILTVSDDEEAKGYSYMTVQILARPIMDFSYSPDTGQFTDTSKDTDGVIKTRQWDFGDGTSSKESNPSHKYTKQGSYIVRMTMTCEWDVICEVSKTINVVESSLDDLTLVYIFLGITSAAIIATTGYIIIRRTSLPPPPSSEIKAGRE